MTAHVDSRRQGEVQEPGRDYGYPKIARAVAVPVACPRLMTGQVMILIVGLSLLMWLKIGQFLWNLFMP